MTTYIVTRHPEALAWLHAHAPELCADAEVRPHWTSADRRYLRTGDVVIGVLPIAVAIVAEICAAGARFYALDLPALAPEMRGKELSAEQMTDAGAAITRYGVSTLDAEAQVSARSIDTITVMRLRSLTASEIGHVVQDNCWVSYRSEVMQMAAAIADEIERGLPAAHVRGSAS